METFVAVCKRGLHGTRGQARRLVMSFTLASQYSIRECLLSLCCVDASFL